MRRHGDTRTKTSAAPVSTKEAHEALAAVKAQAGQLIHEPASSGTIQNAESAVMGRLGRQRDSNPAFGTIKRMGGLKRAIDALGEGHGLRWGQTWAEMAAAPGPAPGPAPGLREPAKKARLEAAAVPTKRANEGAASSLKTSPKAS